MSVESVIIGEIPIATISEQGSAKMNVREAAEKLEISRSLLYRLIEEGRIKCVRIGQRGRRGKIVIREPDIEVFLKECRAETQ